ncbi:MAG TPA: hypothetical protein VIU41_05475 [Geobacteraceae bacterium]
MTDQELWSRGVAALQAEFSRLTAESTARLATLAVELRATRRDLFAISAAAQGEALCADCGGVCCGRGKYHLTTTDLLVWLAAGQPLFTPVFTAPLCPYLGDGNCMMTPEFRPLTCIIFNCEAVDGRLSLEAAAQFRAGEDALREHYREMDRLFGRRLGGSFLLAVAHNLTTTSGRLLADR